MKFNKQATLLTSLTAISTVLLVQTTIDIAQAQRSTFLLSLPCVSSEDGWSAFKQDIAVAREFYTSIMHMDPSASFTCRLPSSARSLYLEFGVADGSSFAAPIRLSVYLNAPIQV